MRRLECSEIWGGVNKADTDVVTRGITASLFSESAEGGKGGDVYYFSVCGHDLLNRIAIADVVGHGEAVSQVGEWMYGCLLERVNSLEGNSVLAALNKLSTEHGLHTMTTAAVISYYRSESTLYFSYAGHPPAFVLHQRAGVWEPLQLPKSNRTANLPLGVDSNAEYDMQTMELCCGDRLFIYTDGLIEAPGKNRELFGDERLLRVLYESRNGTLDQQKEAVLTNLRNHAGETFSHDDVTFLAVEVH